MVFYGVLKKSPAPQPRQCSLLPHSCCPPWSAHTGWQLSRGRWPSCGRPGPPRWRRWRCEWRGTPSWRTGQRGAGRCPGGGGPSLRTDPAIWATQVDRKMFFVHFFPFSRDQLNGLGQQRCFFPLSRTHLGRQGDVTLSPQPGS